MKSIGIALCILSICFLQSSTALAATAGQAKVAWHDARLVSQEKQALHREANVTFAAQKNAANRQAVVDTGKEALHAALNEVETWLEWKDLEVADNPEIPSDLKNTISDDVAANLNKVTSLRKDVDGITNQLELGIVFLTMIGRYTELLADVARNSGLVLVHLGNTRIDTAEEYEAQLRAAALSSESGGATLEKLDAAKSKLAEAQRNVNQAETSYQAVVLPGTPLVHFQEGNNYMRTARSNLLSAHSMLSAAFILLTNS